jgi:hypothetical protein
MKANEKVGGDKSMNLLLLDKFFFDKSVYYIC